MSFSSITVDAISYFEAAILSLPRGNGQWGNRTWCPVTRHHCRGRINYYLAAIFYFEAAILPLPRGNGGMEHGVQ